jgi:hypothetical protein
VISLSVTATGPNGAVSSSLSVTQGGDPLISSTPAFPTATGTDYCRQTGGTNNVDSYIACTPFSGTRFLATVNSRLVDWGYPGTQAWVPTKSGADYCRQIGVKDNVSSRIACTPFNGSRFLDTVNSPIVDWGYAGTEAWVPTAFGA